MAYFAPYIDDKGMHIPKYADIRDDLISSMKQIFGDDIYIDEDSQDYQQISIFAKKIFDTNALALLVYNNRTANTAIGIGLDNLCALVGISRKPATYSTVQLTIVGNPSTVIINGQASDVNDEHKWNLPSEVVIPVSGTITVEATCEDSGDIIAQSNSITKIVTPIYGWFSVTNNFNGSGGVDEESDADLRARYAFSTALPSNTVFESMISSVLSVPGVTRVKGYENDTGSADSNGIPSHSVSMVVEGGGDTDIAYEIYSKKTPGCGTYGSTSVEITSLSGIINDIKFYRPTYKDVYVKISIKKLSSYNESYADEIKQAVSNYINELDIAETVYRSVIWSVATGQMKSIVQPAFSVVDVRLSTDGSTYSAADVSILFNEASASSIENITVEVS